MIDNKTRPVTPTSDNKTIKLEMNNFETAYENLLIKYSELEKENRLLGERCNQLLKDKGELTDRVSNQAESLRVTMLEEEKKGKRIEELEQQIEKMKSIYNCVNGGFGCRLKNGEPCCVSYTGCDMWQLKE